MTKEQEVLTKQAYMDKLRNDFSHCPHCGSSDLTASDYNGDRILSCRVTCYDCGLNWLEEYQLIHCIDIQDIPEEEGKDGD